MFPIGVPLLVFPFAIYNLVVFLMPGFSWTNEIWHVYGMLIEFMTVKAVVSSTFFLLLVISFVDVAASFGVSVRAAVARRDVLLDDAGGGGAGA